MILAKRLAWFYLAAAMAQTPRPLSYGYEVVTIHKAAPGQMNSGFGPGAHGGLRARNDSVMQLLTFAYDAREYQFVGAPDWTQTERFEIALTPEKSEIVVGRTQPSLSSTDGCSAIASGCRQYYATASAWCFAPKPASIPCTRSRSRRAGPSSLRRRIPNTE